jgi:serine/threonine protein kinase/tetratricopeptide (TPR) repeat protein
MQADSDSDSDLEADETAARGKTRRSAEISRGALGDHRAYSAALSVAHATSDASSLSSWNDGVGGETTRYVPETRNAAFQPERFRIGEKLGEGGMGVVYRAMDTRDNREVALKVMKSSLAGAARQRFEREFRSLSNLYHPRCLQVFDFGELDSGPFFTMELFEGKPITSLVGKALDDVLEPLLQITLALDYIHHNGIIHRDIKPSNILVRAATRPNGLPGFDVKLMDFGLAKYYGVKSSLSAEAGFVGTVAYCAPEQLNNDELDHRADLYCLGLVAYELLSGRYPFPEARLGGVRSLMRAQINESPKPLREVRPEIPSQITEAVARYLRKEARRRPDSAALLRDAIAAHLKIDNVTVYLGSTSAVPRAVLTVTGFVCRTREQDLIEDAIRRCLSPPEPPSETPPSLILAVGEPGIGKSSLIREAERGARGHGCQVYQGRCFDGNLAPFQPFVEILRQLVVDLRLQERRETQGPPDEDMTASRGAGLPVEQWARLTAVVKDYAGEILRVAPELRKYLAGEAYRQVDFGREADYIFRALAAFFIEVATLQPLCLSFEDIQWADKSSLDLLRHLCAALSDAWRNADGSTASPRLTIVASARTGYPQIDALAVPLRERRGVLEMSLSPLTESETRELIALRLNCRPEDLSDELVARVHGLCAGNPFFVSETIREWFEKNAIAREGSAWLLTTVEGDPSDLPQTVREAMRLRLQGLTPQARQVVGAAAVIGAVVDVDLLRATIPELSESDVLDALDVLLPRRVFRETGNAGRVEFVHDLLREFPYAELSAVRRRSLHRRVGELLEGRRAKGQPIAPAVLAEHFRAAEEHAQAFAYDLEAARSALDVYAFNNAVTHLEDALRLIPKEADAATRYRLFDMLGAALGASGRLDDAIAAYGTALDYACDNIARARVQHGIGEAYHRKGDYDEALRQFDLALRSAGFPRPKTRLGRCLDLWASSVYFHMLPHWCAWPKGGADYDERAGLALSTYLRTCQIHGQRSVFEYTHNSYKVISITKRSRKPEFEAVGYSKIALNCGMFGMSRLGMHFIAKARKAADASLRDDMKATVEAHFGCANYFGGRLEAAEENLGRAVARLDKVGDWIGMFSHHTLRHLHSVRGDIRSELAEAEYEIATATARGDRDLVAWGFYGKADALARAGQLEEASELAVRAVDELSCLKSTTLGFALGVLGFVRIQSSDYVGAREALERSRLRTFKAAFVVEFSGPTFPLLVESLLGPLWAKTDGAPSRAAAGKAWNEARWARFIGRLYPNYGPHALRVSGRAAFALRRPATALKYFERSIAAAEQLGARYELARALLDASLVNEDKSIEYRRRGHQLLREIGAVVPEAERVPLSDETGRRRSDGGRASSVARDLN